MNKKIVFVIFCSMLVGCGTVKTNIEDPKASAELGEFMLKRPPQCANTPFISKLEATLTNGTDVKVDWSKDLPYSGDAKGIGVYKIYRDKKPITDLYTMGDVSDYNTYDKMYPKDAIIGSSMFYIDKDPKEKGVTYYYVVTAVNNYNNLEQPISKDPKYNASVTIP